MLSYETLDRIADGYIPFIGILALICISQPTWKANWILGIRRLIEMAIGLIIAYGLMWIDSKLEIWPSFGLDYSTHTAVATVLVIFLLYNARQLSSAWLISLVAYFILMRYQSYHSALDIVSTFVVIATSYYLLFFYLFSKDKLIN